MKLRWPFRRSTPPTPPSSERPPLPENWRPGDIAECIADNWYGPPQVRKPRKGARAMVLGVDFGEFADGNEGWGLQLLGFTDWWDARGFRKIVLTDTGADRRVSAAVPARLGERRPELVD